MNVYEIFNFVHFPCSSNEEWMKLLLLLAGDIERNPGPGLGELYVFYEGDVTMML